jgi:hypothetical protein
MLVGISEAIRLLLKEIKKKRNFNLIKKKINLFTKKYFTFNFKINIK